MPAIKLNNVYYNSHKEIDLGKIQGKSFILDFFNSGCSICFSGLPKIRDLQKKFQEKINFLMIGHEDGKIKRMYDYYYKSLNLDLSVAFIDTKQWRLFDIEAVPHLIWIDSTGYVRAVTGYEELTPENINSFLTSGAVTIEKEKAITFAYNYRKPFLINNNGGNDSIFSSRSVFAQWFPGTPSSPVVSMERFNKLHTNPPMFQVLGVGITSLYNYAFWGSDWWVVDNPIYGKVAREPIFEIKDTGILKIDRSTGKNMWSYSLAVRKTGRDTIKRFMNIMQNDLENHFGYTATVELRPCNYWKVTATKNAKDNIKTAGGKTAYTTDHSGVFFVNVPVSELIKELCYSFQKSPAFIDETGIQTNIDLSFRAIMGNFDDVKRALAEKGIVLELVQKPMPTIVVKE